MSKEIKDNGPLWTPVAGLKVEFTRPVSQRREVALVDGIEEHICKGKTVMMVRCFGVYDPIWDDGNGESTPRWGKRPSHITLTHWRLAIPTMKVLPDDWEPVAKPVVFKVTVTEAQLQELAVAVQALAGECPEAKFEALLAAVQPFMR